MPTVTVYLQLGSGPLVKAGTVDLDQPGTALADTADLVHAVAGEITTPTEGGPEPAPVHDTITRPPAPPPAHAPRTLLLGASEADVAEIAERLGRVNGVAAEDVIKATPRTGIRDGLVVDQVYRTPTYTRLSDSVREPVETAVRRALAATERNTDDR